LLEKRDLDNATKDVGLLKSLRKSIQYKNTTENKDIIPVHPIVSNYKVVKSILNKKYGIALFLKDSKLQSITVPLVFDFISYKSVIPKNYVTKNEKDTLFLLKGNTEYIYKYKLDKGKIRFDLIKKNDANEDLLEFLDEFKMRLTKLLEKDKFKTFYKLVDEFKKFDIFKKIGNSKLNKLIDPMLLFIEYAKKEGQEKLVKNKEKYIKVLSKI
jgi:hypothetical protein